MNFDKIIPILDVLNKFASRSTEIKDIRELALEVERILEDVIEMEYTGLFLYDFVDKKLKLYFAKGFTEEERLEAERTVMDRHPGHVFRTKQMLYVPDVERNNPPMSIDSKRSFLVRSRLSIPVFNGDNIVGVFSIASPEKYKFTEEQIAVFSFIGNLAGSVYGHILNRNELRNTRQEAISANIAKSQFLANMSHEIRTPLNAINGLIRLLEDTQMTDEQEKLIKGLNSSSEGLLEIVNDILDFTKIEAGQMELFETEFFLDELVKKVFDSFEYKAAEKEVKLQIKFDKKITDHLRGDNVRLRQVLVNLMNNAIKFTQKGSVTLDCRLLKSTRVSYIVYFNVSDTGIGIAEENISKIFQSFQQEDTGTTRSYGGTGLGLAISKQLVELMGGVLEVRSRKNKGSEFFFSLPFKKTKKPDKHSVEEITELNTKPLNGIRVLLVEDNQFNQFIAKSMLEKWKMIVALANNGREALEMLKGDTYQIVLMDLQMPEMGGLEATRRIRSELKLDVPVIALTANAVKGVIEECYAAGMNDYIAKPFNPDTLAKKIKTLVDQTD
ncbi:MAG: response regulator [Bacteroidetes bacterium]|nr:response regulator [Bacteroidota bacterium]